MGLAPKAIPLWRITNNKTGAVEEVRRQSPLAAVVFVLGWYLKDCDWEKVNER